MMPVTKKTRNRKAGKYLPYEWLYLRFHRVAAKKEIPVLVSFKEFLEFLKVKQCHYCKIEIVWASPYGYRDKLGNSNKGYQLDRKDTSLPYSKDNCVVCCASCNFTKTDMLSYEEMKVIGDMRFKSRP